MLTSQANREIRENVITDVNANVMPTTHERPRATLSPEAALLFNKSVISRPLMVPEVCSIRVKNLEYKYRWVNKASRNGAMYMQRRAQGFTNATTDDVEVLGGDATATTGEINAGDLILMKIRADLYDAAIKWNMEKAAMLQRSRGMYLKNASSDVHSDAKSEAVSIGQEQNLAGSAFIPANADALIKAAAPTAELARKQTQEIRENIASAKKSQRIEE